MRTTTKEAKIYVGTYAKYNNGSISGKWLDLSDYSDIAEFYQACRELHSDEEDPEFMFQDYEVPNILQNAIGESYLSEDIFEIIQALENATYDLEVYEAYSNYCPANGESLEDFEKLISDCDEAYYGEYETDEDFAQELLESTGCIPASLPNYIHIDWGGTARDIMMDYHTDNGYYFRCL